MLDCSYVRFIGLSQFRESYPYYKLLLAAYWPQIDDMRSTPVRVRETRSRFTQKMEITENYCFDLSFYLLYVF